MNEVERLLNELRTLVVLRNGALAEARRYRRAINDQALEIQEAIREHPEHAARVGDAIIAAVS